MFISGTLGAAWNGFAFERQHPELTDYALKDYIDFTQPLAELDAAEWFGVSTGISMVGLLLLIPLIVAALKGGNGCNHTHHDHS